MKTQDPRMVRYPTTRRSNGISEYKSIHHDLQTRPLILTRTVSNDTTSGIQPIHSDLPTFGKMEDCLGMFKAYRSFWSTYASLSVFSGQCGTLTLKLDFTYEEHLCAVALTGSWRGAQTHPLASYFLVRPSIALCPLSGKYRCFFKHVA